MTSTIGIDYASKLVVSDGVPVKATIWDTAGQERFRSLAASYYKGSDGVVTVYDITKRESFSSVKGWMRELRSRVGESVDVALVGNKADMAEDRKVSAEEGAALAREVGAGGFFEVSCLSGEGVKEVFMSLIGRACKRKLKEPKAAPRAVRAGTADSVGPLDGGGGRDGRGCC